jgi:hypothetical protein
VTSSTTAARLTVASGVTHRKAEKSFPCFRLEAMWMKIGLIAHRTPLDEASAVNFLSSLQCDKEAFSVLICAHD